MTKRYEQYCPMAHALDLVGDRWALLIVRDLMHGPLRYTDLVERLPGIGTNILAARLRDLERHGVVTRRILPPPAASRVYDLTDYGRELRPALRELALWGARSLGLLNSWIARIASRGTPEDEADLLSYVFFDRCFTGCLVEMGREDARRRQDEILELLGAEAERRTD